MNGRKKSRSYRALEMIPGLLTWLTFMAAIFLSYWLPEWVAIFIILFDLYWVLKAINIAIHLVNSYGKIGVCENYDWLARCAALRDVPDLVSLLKLEKLKTGSSRQKRDLDETVALLEGLPAERQHADYKRIYQLILLPTVKESAEVLTASIESYLAADYPTDKMVLVLACEERAGMHARQIAAEIQNKYAHRFFRFMTTFHPDGIEGEVKAKGANLTYAGRRALELIRESGIPEENVLVSAFDADTVVSKQYFALLTFTFLTAKYPARSSYQPIPLYNNNVWDSPAINRLAAVTSSFWQMVESSRPDRLVTFSSHSMSLKALVDVDFWPVDVVSEDSQIFWRCFLHYHGDYRVAPLFVTVSLDAVVLENYYQSLVGQYKQYRRWAWGVIDWPYLINGFRHDKKIPWTKKLLYGYRLLEGHYFWATAALMIAALGWLPLLLGGHRISNQVLAVNLPEITGTIMTVSLIFLIFSVVINFILLPKRPRRYTFFRHVSVLLQWVLVPLSSIVFGSLPAVDAQTRLLLGKYMEFWVTPKVRKDAVLQKVSS